MHAARGVSFSTRISSVNSFAVDFISFIASDLLFLLPVFRQYKTKGVKKCQAYTDLTEVQELTALAREQKATSPDSDPGRKLQANPNYRHLQDTKQV